MRAMLDAALEISRAEREARESLRPLARESASRRARAAEADFITARLADWQAVLTTNQAHGAAIERD